MAKGSSSFQSQNNQAALPSKTNSRTLLKQDGKQRNPFSILADHENTEDMMTKFTEDEELTQALMDTITSVSMYQGPMTDNPVPPVGNKTTKPDSKSAATFKSAESDKNQVEAQETHVYLTKEKPELILNVKTSSDHSLQTKNNKKKESYLNLKMALTPLREETSQNQDSLNPALSLNTPAVTQATEIPATNAAPNNAQFPLRPTARFLHLNHKTRPLLFRSLINLTPQDLNQNSFFSLNQTPNTIRANQNLEETLTSDNSPKGRDNMIPLGIHEYLFQPYHVTPHVFLSSPLSPKLILGVNQERESFAREREVQYRVIALPIIKRPSRPPEYTNASKRACDG
ncbi:hypothetical protein Salat_1176400 [Sesamum alatum]|uniref:Uncharacterized protein n=1 Tax=Sesamum alatum TaxID=300844 RepID=A0AAE2CNK3_9LAMI|nr:hypothetical protein Salat_1176400 [Sesamum alatum]